MTPETQDVVQKAVEAIAKEMSVALVPHIKAIVEDMAKEPLDAEELLEKLDGRLAEKIDAAVEAAVTAEVEQQIEDMDLSDEINNVMDEHDFSDQIESAVEDSLKRLLGRATLSIDL